jgi:hypothetical protein
MEFGLSDDPSLSPSQSPHKEQHKKAMLPSDTHQGRSDFQYEGSTKRV